MILRQRVASCAHKKKDGCNRNGGERMEHAARTHIGLVRQVNQDSYAVVTDIPSHQIFIVADGMGGHSAGEVASTLATQVVADYLRTAFDSTLVSGETQELAQEISAAILQANQEIYQRADSSNGLSGMGTTVVAAIVTPSEIALGHIGDSRAYLFHEGTLIQLTEDHSLVNELVKSGQLSESEAKYHPQRNVLLRALGTDLTVEADCSSVPWHTNDILLLCSDGVWNFIGTETLCELVKQTSSMRELTDQLIKKALDAGGNDNITAIAIRNDTPHPVKGDTTL
jgi:PPM family protein phosphatase